MPSTPEVPRQNQEVFSFADRELTFEFSHPSFVEDDRTFMRWLEYCREQGGTAIVYIHFQDDCSTLEVSDRNGGFHYALLGAMSAPPTPSESPSSTHESLYREAAWRVIPLPVFAHIIGLAKAPKEEGVAWDYEVTRSFGYVARLLRKTFKGGAFFASRHMWDREFNPHSSQRRPPRGYAIKMLHGASEICRGSLELLQDYLNVFPEGISDPTILQLLAIARNTTVERLEPGEPIDEEDIIAIMRGVVGIRRLGYPEPPRAKDLRHYWTR